METQPRHPEYAELSERVLSFGNWPSPNTQTAGDLADAGFFYCGTDDCVRCFSCGGGLRKWEDGDIPWMEHARQFPYCVFVRHKKGNQFVEDVLNSYQQESAYPLNGGTRKQSFTSGSGSSGYGTYLKDEASTVRFSEDESTTLAHKESSGDRSTTLAHEESSGDRSTTLAHEESSGDRSTTLAHEESSGDRSTTLAYGESSGDRSTTLAHEESSGDRSSGDISTTLAYGESSGDGSTTLAHEESSEEGCSTVKPVQSQRGDGTNLKAFYSTAVSLRYQNDIPRSPVYTTTGEQGHALSENIEFSPTESIESGEGQNDESMQLSEKNLSLNIGTAEPENNPASLTSESVHSESITSTCRVFNSQGTQTELAVSESPLPTLADEPAESDRGELPGHSENTSSPSPTDQLLPLANPLNKNIGQQTRISSQRQTEAAIAPFQFTQGSRYMHMHQLLQSFMGSMANQMTNNENTGQQTSIPQPEAANMYFDFTQESWHMYMRQLSGRFIGSTGNQMPFMNILNYALPYVFHQLANNLQGPVQSTEVAVENHTGLIVNENNVTVREVQAIQEGDDFIDLDNEGHITGVVRNYVQNSMTQQDLGPNLEIRHWP